MVSAFSYDRIQTHTGGAPNCFRTESLLRTMPSLFSFRLAQGHALENLPGVTLSDVELTLVDSEGKVKGKGKRIGSPKGDKVQTQRGSLLITHHGVSGPAALRLSSFAAADCRVSFN